MDNRLATDRGMLPEPMFLRAFTFERKRAERSRKPFVLMLLHSRQRSRNVEDDDLVARSRSVIASAIRETDIRGWHRQDQVVGVIFAEVGDATDHAVAGLRSRLTAALRSRLGPEQLERLQISFQAFPSDDDQCAAAPSPVVCRDRRGETP